MRVITKAFLASLLVTFPYMVSAMPIIGTPANDFFAFSGTPGTPVNTTLISPSGVSVPINGTFNFNNATYDGLGGFDIISMTNQADFFDAGSFLNIGAIFAGSGNDVVDASLSNMAVIMTGGAGNDIFFGSPFADTITASTGLDFIDAGAGDDFLSLDGGDGTAIGGAGNDIYAVAPTAVAGDVHTIIETGGASTDILDLPDGVVFGDLLFSFANDDLRIELPSGAQILSVDQFLTSTTGLDSIRFGDDSLFDIANLTRPTAMPEPATLALFGSGLAGFAWMRRNRYKSA